MILADDAEARNKIKLKKNYWFIVRTIGGQRELEGHLAPALFLGLLALEVLGAELVGADVADLSALAASQLGLHKQTHAQLGKQSRKVAYRFTLPLIGVGFLPPPPPLAPPDLDLAADAWRAAMASGSPEASAAAASARLRARRC